MEYRNSDKIQHFREEVRDWLRANKPREQRPGDTAGQLEFDRAWQRAQYDGGWAGISWPTEYGGRGLSPSQQLIWAEEYAAAHCPHIHDAGWLGLNHAGPTLIARGAEAQKSFHLQRILKGEAMWCQGFSEPDAGSDLASLRTRGVVDGDHLVINGQKIWTTLAHLADYQELLVRTGPPESRHRGLTWVICDMHAPGVEVRPIQALDGTYHNCEVFYDNVRIPLSNVVGEIDGGWSVAMTTFGFERGPAVFGSFCELEVALDELIIAARNPSGDGLGAAMVDDDAIAEGLGILRAELQSLRSLVLMMVSADERGSDLGAEGTLLNLPYGELEQEVARFAMRILGPSSLSMAEPSLWSARYLRSFAATIAGGTSEIQRNIISERLLGLPR